MVARGNTKKKSCWISRDALNTLIGSELEPGQAPSGQRIGSLALYLIFALISSLPPNSRSSGAAPIRKNWHQAPSIQRGDPLLIVEMGDDSRALLEKLLSISCSDTGVGELRWLLLAWTKSGILTPTICLSSLQAACSARLRAPLPHNATRSWPCRVTTVQRWSA